MHVHWALQSVSKDEHDWLLVDDDGQVIKRPVKQKQVGPSKLYYDLDESYFLTDPQNFIYRYFFEHWVAVKRELDANQVNLRKCETRD